MTKDQFRLLAFVEAISLLLLFFIAMPLKYLAGMPEAVRVVGMIHGILFSLFVLAGVWLLEPLGWSVKKLVLSWIIASLPFGPFLFDHYLFKESQ